MRDGASDSASRARTVTGAIVHDNQMGARDDANATTALGGGSIVIHL